MACSVLVLKQHTGMELHLCIRGQGRKIAFETPIMFWDNVKAAISRPSLNKPSLARRMY